MEELQFKWIFEPPAKQVKQPDTFTPSEFDSLVKRIDNNSVDPLVAARNQAMLWMCYGSCFRAKECARWLVREALYPNGEIVPLTRIRAEATKGSKPVIAPIFIDQQKHFLNRWLELRVQHHVGVNRTTMNTEQYRGLDPDSYVFLSYRHYDWVPFSLQRKVVNGTTYWVATSVQNTLTNLYKSYGFPRCASHSARHSMGRLAKKILTDKRSDPELRRVIQNLLHHRSEESQKSYVDIDWQALREKSKCMFER